MRLHHLFLLILLMITATFARKAKWVEKRPTSSDAYIGIAMVTKSEYESKDEWMKVAEGRALNNISGAISVTIEGNSSLSLTTTTTDQTELYKEDIKSFTKANLEGYEYVESWEDRKEYWVYYRLKKSTWQQIEQTRLREGVKKAESFLNNGERLELKGHALSAARSYIKAFSEIVPILYLNPTITHLGNELPLISHIDDKMISLLNAIKIEISQPAYRGVKADFSTNEPQFNLKLNSHAATSFPLIVGKEKRFTDAKGAVIISKKIIDQEIQSLDLPITITTDIEQVVPSEEKSLITRNWLSNMNWPSATAQIQFIKPAVYIESLEDGYDDLPYEQLENAVKERLDGIGYSIARFPEDANFRIIIKSSTRPAGSMGSLYFTYLDITWTIYNKSGDELMKESIPAVKGGALSYDDAGIKAYTKGSTTLGERVITWIKEKI